MSDLTDGQITTLRDVHIRDRYERTPTPVAISNYNRSGKEFFTDAQIRAIDDDVTLDYRELLDDLEAEAKATRIGEGDSEADAETTAAAVRLLGRFKLIGAECIDQMLEDPAFKASLLPGDSSGVGQETEQAWARRAQRNRAWVMSRAGHVSIEVERR